MVRNPTKRANARHLCAHLDLIEQHKNGDPSDDDDSYEDEAEEESPEPKTTSAKPEARKVSMGSSPSQEEDDLPLPNTDVKHELTAEV